MTVVGDAYVDLHARVDALEAEVKRGVRDALEKGTKDPAGDAGDTAGKSFSERFATFVGGNLGKIMTGLGLGAIVAKGFSDGLDLQAAQDKLAAQLGATPEMAKEFATIAGNVYKGAWGDSIDEVNEALRSTWQSGLLEEDAPAKAIEGVTTRVIDLSKAFDQDLNRVTAASSTLLKTGLVGSAEEAFDVITRGFQQGADKGEDLLDTFIEYPSVLRSLGLDAATATGLLTQGLQSGARNADVVADALKEFQIRATDASKSSAQGFELLGLNAAEMTAQIAKGGDEAKAGLDVVLDRLRATEDPVKRNAAAVALFGTKAEDLGQSLFALDVDTAVEGLGDVTGAAERMSDTLNDNAKTKIEAFKRKALQGLAEFMANKVIPAIERVAPKVEEFARAFQERVAPVIADATVKAQQFSDWFELHVLPILQRVVEFIQQNWPAIQQTISDVMATVQAVTEAAIEVISFVWEHFGDLIVEKIQYTFEFVQSTIENALRIIRGIMEVITGLIHGDWSQVWQGIQDIFGGVWDQMKAVVEFAINEIKTTIETVLRAIGLIFEGAWNAMKDAAAGAFGALLGTVSSTVSSIADEIGKIPGHITSVFWEVLGAAGQIGGAIKDGIIAGVKGTGGAALDFAEAFGRAVYDFIDDKVLGAFRSALLTMAHGLASVNIPGIGRGFDAASRTIEGLVDKLHLPEFAEGGFTDWPAGEARLAVLHGQEAVFNERQLRALSDALSTSRTSGTLAGMTGPLFVVQIDNVTSDDAQRTGETLAASASIALRHLLPDLVGALGG